MLAPFSTPLKRTSDDLAPQVVNAQNETGTSKVPRTRPPPSNGWATNPPSSKGAHVRTATMRVGVQNGTGRPPMMSRCHIIFFYNFCLSALGTGIVDGALWRGVTDDGLGGNRWWLESDREYSMLSV